ncbi:MAG: glycine zipper 2TM domain-containing protein [Desulfovibrio sp.]|nr:MAG: glycine zipper 2TM domain-containing protein [Desulfovibrio sp.]
MACQQRQSGYNSGYGGSGIGGTEVGAVAGGVAGGVIGSQIGSGTGNTVATIAGVLLGAAVGGYLGSYWDQNDRQYASYTLQNNYDNQTTQWRNPNSGYYNEMTPTRTYQNQGRYCREFTQTVYIDGQPQRAVGTACQRADGQWEIVNSQSYY